MSDPLIALGSVIGVGVLVLLNWLLGGWTPARLIDREAAIARWHQDFPGDRVEAVLLDHAGEAALLDCSGDAPGLIVARGDGFVTRRLDPRLVRAIMRPRSGRLEIRLYDLSLPHVVLEAGEDAISDFLATSGLEPGASEDTTLLSV